MVLGIVSLVLCMTLWLSFILAVTSLILGIVAKVKGGGGMAVAGIVLSSITIVMLVLFFVFIFAIADSSYDNFYDYYYSLQIQLRKLF